MKVCVVHRVMGLEGRASERSGLGAWWRGWAWVVGFLWCLGCRGESSAPPEAKPEQGAVVLRLWHTFNADETKTIEELLREFHRENPGVKVEATVLPFGAARNRLSAALAQGEGPDVARAEVAWIPELAEAKTIAPLGEEVEPSAHLPQALPLAQYGGQVWAYPQGIDCLVLYYDRARLREVSEAPPRDTEALIRVAKRLTVDDQGRDGFHPQHDPTRAARHGLFLKSDGYYFLPFLWAWGGEAVDPDTRGVRIADPASVEAAGRFQDMALRQNIIPEKIDVATEYQEELARFGDGRVAMIVNGPWAAREILASPRFSDPSNLGVAPVPRGLDDRGGSPVGGHGYVISARSSHPKEARLLGAFLSGPRAQALLARRNHIPPTLAKVYDEPELAQDPLLTAFRQALDESHPRAVFPGMARLFDALTPAVQRLLRGEGDPATLMGGVAREWSTVVPKP